MAFVAALLSKPLTASPQSQNNPPELPKLHSAELNTALAAINRGQSILVLGESGSGKTSFIEELKKVLGESHSVAVASYSGSLKVTLSKIAEGWDCPTEIETERGFKPMSNDQIKQELLDNCNGKILICDNLNRFPASLRYWLELIIEEGCTVAGTAISSSDKDVSLKLLRIELSPPSDLQIRAIMRHRASELGIVLGESQLSGLQSRVGRNLGLARMIVDQAAAGNVTIPEHREYVDISPFIMAGLAALGVVRFLGLGMGDRTLYIIGGIAVLAGLTLKYAGKGFAPKERRLGG